MRHSAEKNVATEVDFFVRFWGVRGSIPCPGAATSRYGGNTSCIEVRCGEHLLIFDAGTGFSELGKRLRAEGLRDLDLPVTAAWMWPSQVLRNLVESLLVARTARGRRWLERRSDRRVEADLARRFGRETPGPRDLAA